MTWKSISIAVEGDLDDAVLRKVLQSVGIEVTRSYVMGGKDRLRLNLARYNEAARFAPWVALTDLNEDASCAPVLARTLVPAPNPNFQLHIVVHAIEAWLMADRDEIAQFLEVLPDRIPRAPEELSDPKKVLIDIARCSAARDIREEIVPRPGSGISQGPGYVTRMIEFTVQRWSPDRACQSAPSLKRALERLAKWSVG